MLDAPTSTRGTAFGQGSAPALTLMGAMHRYFRPWKECTLGGEAAAFPDVGGGVGFEIGVDPDGWPTPPTPPAPSSTPSPKDSGTATETG